jgi:energy-coupling factor transport system ATP-binding protein
LEGALADMGITELRERVIASLSGGQRQKVAIASILALEPKVLVLDEPTAELDPASSLQVFRLLARYAREHGTTVVVVEQKIALLSQFADLLVVLDDGKIRFADAPRKVLANSTELLEIGVNCPRATTLLNRLAADGRYAGPVCRNVREACDALVGILSAAPCPNPASTHPRTAANTQAEAPTGDARGESGNHDAATPKDTGSEVAA